MKTQPSVHFPKKNIFLVLALNKYAKADVEVSRFCITLPDFLIFLKIFYTGLCLPFINVLLKSFFIFNTFLVNQILLVPLKPGFGRGALKCERCLKRDSHFFSWKIQFSNWFEALSFLNIWVARSSWFLLRIETEPSFSSNCWNYNFLSLYTIGKHLLWSLFIFHCFYGYETSTLMGSSYIEFWKKRS